MKRKILLVVFSLVSLSLYSQKIEDGLRISFGLPFAKYGKFDNNFQNASETNYPSFMIQADKPWRDGFRLGAYAGFSGQKHEFRIDDFSEINHTYYRVGGVLSYDLNDLLDAINISPESGVKLYASLKTGLTLEHIKAEVGVDEINDKENNLLFDLGILIGGRYNISQGIDIFSELGWGNAGFVTIGLSFDM